MNKLIFAVLVSCCIFKICRSIDGGGSSSLCDMTKAMTAAPFCQRALLDTLSVYSARRIQHVSTLSCCCRFGLKHCLGVAFQAGNCTGRENDLKVGVTNIRHLANEELFQMGSEDCPTREVLGDKNGLCQGLFGYFNSAIRQIKSGEVYLRPENMTKEKAESVLGQPPRIGIFSVLEEYEPKELFEIFKKMEGANNNSNLVVPGDFPTEETSNETVFLSERGARCLPITIPEFNSSNLGDSWNTILARYNEFVANSTRDFRNSFNESNASAMTLTNSGGIGVINGTSASGTNSGFTASSPFNFLNDTVTIGNITANITSMTDETSPISNDTTSNDTTSNESVATNETSETRNVPFNETNLPLLSLVTFNPASNSSSNFRLNGSRSLDEVEYITWNISNRRFNESGFEYEELHALPNDSEGWVFVAEVMICCESSDSRCVIDPAVWQEIVNRLNSTVDPSLNRILMALPNASDPSNRSGVSTFGRSLDQFESLNHTTCSQVNETLTRFVIYFSSNSDSKSNYTVEANSESRWNEITNDTLNFLKIANESRTDETADESREARNVFLNYDAYVKELEKLYNESMDNMTQFFDSFKTKPLQSFPGVQGATFNSGLHPSFNYTDIFKGSFMVSSNDSLHFTEVINDSVSDKSRDKLRNARSFLDDYNTYMKELGRQYNESLANMTRFFGSFKLPTLPSFNTAPIQFPSFNLAPFNASLFPSFNTTPFSTIQLPKWQFPQFNASLFPSFNWSPINSDVIDRFDANPNPVFELDFNSSPNSTNSTRSGARSLDDDLEDANETQCAKMEELLDNYLHGSAVANTSATNNTENERFIFRNSIDNSQDNVTDSTTDHERPIKLELEENLDSSLNGSGLDKIQHPLGTILSVLILQNDTYQEDNETAEYFPETTESKTSNQSQERGLLNNSKGFAVFNIGMSVLQSENVTNATNLSRSNNDVPDVSISNLTEPPHFGIAFMLLNDTNGNDSELSMPSSITGNVLDRNETALINLHSIQMQNSSDANVSYSDHAKRGRSLNLWDINSNSTNITVNTSNFQNQTWRVVNSSDEIENVLNYQDSKSAETTTIASPVANSSSERDARQLAAFSLPTISPIIVRNMTTSTRSTSTSTTVWTPKNFNPEESDLLNAIRNINASPMGPSLAQLILIVNLFSLILINF